MTGTQEVFERTEKKYLLSPAQYRALQKALAGKMQGDAYGLYTVSNLYYDTEDFALIRASIEKPVFKEKLRLRCYGTPQHDSPAFAEIKRKFKGVVHKRRATLPYAICAAYLGQGIRPHRKNQIIREIDWFLRTYDVEPKVALCYDRTAYLCPEDPTLRLTFDENIRFREKKLNLQLGSWGEPLLDDDSILLEVKSVHALPLWLTQLLASLCIFPISFSKYGLCYQEFLHPKQCLKGGLTRAS